MLTKEEEIAEFRKKHLFYTEETRRKWEQDQLLQSKAGYREKLYDAILTGESYVIRSRERDFKPCLFVKQTDSKTA